MLYTFFAQIAIVGVSEQRQPAGRLKREYPFAFHAQRCRFFCGNGNARSRKARQVVFVVDDKSPFVCVVDDVVAEFKAKRGQLLVDRFQLLFFSGDSKAPLRTKAL